MRQLSIEQVEPGHYLGRTIFSSNGTVLLAEGVQLTVFMINTLRRIGVTYIYVKDELFDDVVVEELVSEETKQAVIRQMNEIYDSIRSGKEFHAKSVSLTIDELLDDVMKNKDVLIQLNDIRTMENAAYLHALNVCVMSAVVGMNLGYSPSQLKELAIGALLHDIGKVGWRPEDDSGPEKRRHHTWRGFEMLKNKREYSLLIAHIPFQHHENVDGTGKPRGVTGDVIHPYAKIVAVANTYDNLLHEFNELGKKMLPHEACERMMAMSDRELDRNMLTEFLKTVSIYPTGSSVRLSNREVGVVVGQHRGLPTRPIVRVVKRDGDDLSVTEYDLARHPTLFIDAVLS